MLKRTVRLNPFESAHRFNKYFTVEYKGNIFLFGWSIDSDSSEYSLTQLKWNFWKGTYESYEYGKVHEAICDTILKLSTDQPEKFPLAGEHYYAVIDESKRIKIRKEKQHYYLSEKFKLIPFFVRMAVAVLLCCIYTFAYINGSGMMWARAAFPAITRNDLEIIIWIVAIAGTSLMYILNKNNRDFWDLCCDAIISVNIFTLFGTVKSNKDTAILIGVIIGALLIFSIIPKIYATVKTWGTRRCRKNLARALGGISSAFVICVWTCLIAIRLFGIPGVTINSNYKHTENDTEKLVEDYIYACQYLKEDTWNTLDNQSKVDVLQTISDYESIYVLGCEPSTVQAGYPRSICVLGSYNNVLNTITLNEEHLKNDSVCEVLETLLHETRHAWQHSVADMYNDLEKDLKPKHMKLSFFQNAVRIRDNFDCYSGSGDYDSYYSQVVEEDSRTWSRHEIEIYKYYIFPDEQEEEKTIRDDEESH